MDKKLSFNNLSVMEDLIIDFEKNYFALKLFEECEDSSHQSERQALLTDYVSYIGECVRCLKCLYNCVHDGVDMEY